MAKIKDKKSEVKYNKSSGNMGVTAKGAMVKESKEKIAKVSQPGFTAKNEIFPCADASKTKGSLDKSMFSSNALKSEIPAQGTYAAKKSKKAGVDKSVFASKSNEIWPTSNY